MSSETVLERHDRPEPRLGTVTLMLIAIAVAVIGGAVALAVGLASGALHTTKHATTVVEPAPASVPASGSPSAAWASVYARVAPGTVDITVQSTTSVNTPFGSTQQQETALGSGFVIDGSGHILTAAHVVTGATQVSVAFQNGVTRTAKILGEDDSSDVAVLQVEPAGLTLSPLALGSSQALEVGDAVGVIGDPLGFDRSLSTGVVSGIDRTIEAPDGFIIAHSIQTDAALNPGNSGGPLLDSGGRVIGIADQIATGTNQFGRSTAETSSGVGFAVPIDLAKVELSRLKRGEPVTHAYLGVSTAATTSAGQQGALIAGVQPGTPAAKAGLAAGDVIVAFNGMAIHGANDLIDALAAAHVGVKVKITVLRGTSRLTFTVTLAAQPAHPASE